MEFAEYFDTLTEVLSYKTDAIRVYSAVNLDFSFDYSLIVVSGEIFYKVIVVIHGKKGAEKKQNKL